MFYSSSYPLQRLAGGQQTVAELNTSFFSYYLITQNGQIFASFILKQLDSS